LHKQNNRKTATQAERGNSQKMTPDFLPGCAKKEEGERDSTKRRDRRYNSKACAQKLDSSHLGQPRVEFTSRDVAC